MPACWAERKVELRYWIHSVLAAGCCRSRVFTPGQLAPFWGIHFCGLLDWICSESCSVNYFALSKIVLGLSYAIAILIYLWSSAHRIFEPWNSANTFHFVKRFLKNQIPRKHLIKLKEKLRVHWMFLNSQGIDEKLKCAVHILLLPVEREIHTVQWKIVFFIVCCWLGLIKGFTMVQKSYISWSNRSCSRNCVWVLSSLIS